MISPHARRFAERPTMHHPLEVSIRDEIRSGVISRRGARWGRIVRLILIVASLLVMIFMAFISTLIALFVTSMQTLLKRFAAVMHTVSAPIVSFFTLVIVHDGALKDLNTRKWKSEGKLSHRQI